MPPAPSPLAPSPSPLAPRPSPIPQPQLFPSPIPASPSLVSLLALSLLQPMLQLITQGVKNAFRSCFFFFFFNAMQIYEQTEANINL